MAYIARNELGELVVYKDKPSKVGKKLVGEVLRKAYVVEKQVFYSLSFDDEPIKINLE